MNVTKNQAILSVVSSNGRNIHFFDAKTYEKVGKVTSPIPEPHEVCIDSRRQLLYVSITYRSGIYGHAKENGHEILVIDIPTFTLLDTIDISPEFAPHGLAFDERNDLLYASVESNGGGVIVIHPDTRQVINRISTGAKGSHWFVIHPEGTKGYSANKEAPFISVLDLRKKELMKKISVPFGSEELAISPNGHRVYVPSPSLSSDHKNEQPTLSMIDTETDVIIKTIAFSDIIHPVHVTIDGKVLLGHLRYQEKPSAITKDIVDSVPGYVSILDGETLQVLGTVEIDLFPLNIRSSSDGTIGYVSNFKSGTVSVLDLIHYKKIHTLKLDQQDQSVPSIHPNAHGIAYIEI
ncbi:YncE family protein [Brevibacillus sp. VP]|uniref:YncE family protein n=1 Tax=unclassified Brevibacillus TaxID=2684853 RepID=UPI000E2EA6AE|nr:YncE family protein [Brevibacillus sp. VP]RFB38011.1 YncE family protein [Brevibacillus sp. VP]